jgi:hypothetical protein
MSYTSLSQVTRQFPDVGGTDHCGGNAYRNTAGLGVVWPAPVENPRRACTWPHHRPRRVTATHCSSYRSHACTTAARCWRARRCAAPRRAASRTQRGRRARLGIADGTEVTVHIGGRELHVQARLDRHAPEGAALLPRDLAGVGELDGPGVLVGHAQKVRG